MSLENWSPERACRGCPLGNAVRVRPELMDKVVLFGQQADDLDLSDGESVTETSDALSGFANRFMHDTPAIGIDTPEEIEYYGRRAAKLCLRFSVDDPYCFNS